MDSKGQANIAAIVIGVAVAAVAALIGVSVFLTVNTSQNVKVPLLDLTPTIVAAVLIIAALGAILALT
jgi:heme/copper-type cytochrome/quinol oxidase subunit 4